MKSANVDSTPDKPIGFGRKNQWIAAKCDSSRDLAEALQLKEIQPANWKSGFSAAYGYTTLVFVTPPLNGWVLAVGGLPDPPEASKEGYWSRKDLHSPDEDDVFRMAQSWSIDPSELESKDLPPSSGLVGNLTGEGSL